MTTQPRAPARGGGAAAKASAPAPVTPETPETPVGIETHVEGIVSQIGPRLRDARSQRSYSLQQLATRSDVSSASIHKIERNGMVPTITTLLKLSAALELPLAYFIEVDEEPDPVAVIRAAHRPEVFSSHAGLRLNGISGSYSQFRTAAAIADLDPGASSGTKPLLHPGEELVLVLEGAVRFTVLNKVYDLAKGDSLQFLGECGHSWSNPGRRPARLMWMALRAD